jgi:hypothetical protein
VSQGSAQGGELSLLLPAAGSMLASCFNSLSSHRSLNTLTLYFHRLLYPCCYCCCNCLFFPFTNCCCRRRCCVFYMFNEGPDAVCVFFVCSFPFQKKFQLSGKRIGQHKSISISLSIHILMSKKYPRNGESGGGRQAPKYLELLTRRNDPPPACARAPLLRDASSTVRALWMDGWTGPIGGFWRLAGCGWLGREASVCTQF